MAFACACLALAIGAASASAAASWLPPADISGTNELIDGRPKVAVDPAGNAVAIWERHVGGEQVIEVSERLAGGEWSTFERISSANEEGHESQVAIDDAGNTYAVWVEEGTSLTSVIRSAVRPLGGEWSVPENFSPPFQGGNPQVSLAAAAGAVAVWTIDDGDDIVVQAAVRPAGGEWSDPEDLSDVSANAGPPDEKAGSPDVGMNAAGEAVAVWQHFDGSNDIVQAAALPAGGEWSEPDDLSEEGENAREPQVAIDPDGDAVATWSRWGGSALIVQAAVRPAGDDWSEAEDLSEARLPGEAAPVAIDAAGNAVALWVHPDDDDPLNGGILQAAVLPAGGEWSQPEDLSPPGQDQGASYPAVATNGAVGAVAVWRQRDDSEYRVQASVRPPGGEWSEPEDLSAAGEAADLPDLALDAAGNGIAVFGRLGDDGPLVQARGYDFVGPQLSDLRIPATGTVGEPVTFGVFVFDVFPLATSWTFGDGGPGASGSTVSHVYTAPGVYPVTVSTVDGGGNTSTQSGSIAIAAAATKPPPPRRQITLALRIEGESLRKLRRTGTLSVAASVNEAASVALSGQAKLKVRRARGGTRTKLVPVFAPKTVRLAAAAEGKVTLALSKRGRKTLQSLSQVRLLIAGEARDDVGGTATKTAARTLR